MEVEETNNTTPEQEVKSESQTLDNQEVDTYTVPKETSKPPKYHIDEDPFFPLHKCGEVISCTLCGANITDAIQFRCDECSNILCKKCLMNRVEKNGHLSTHGYHVSECLDNMSLYSINWSAKDDLRLMEAMEEFRFCNWENISNYVDKPEKECVDHYFRCYLSNPDLVPSVSQYISTPYVEPPVKVVPDTVSTVSDISGYNPLRDDYDYEYDNDAELMLKDVEILGDEDENEKELKTCMLRAFNRRLEEREQRKAFVLERGLINMKSLIAEEKKKSKAEQDLSSRMKPFSRFLSKEDYAKLLKGLTKELKLRERIIQLQKMRRDGIRTLEEADRQNEGENKDNPVLLNVDQMDGVELLSPEEKRLCSLLHIVPRHYLSIKSTIIQECCKNGFVGRDESTKITLDVERKQKVYDFFISCGWITSASQMNE